MFLLLPPSEGKHAPRAGKPLGELSLPSLTVARQRVLDVLSGLDRDDAVTILGLTPGLAAEAERNCHLKTAPTAPASKIYTGVLYESLDFAGLAPSAQRQARKSVLVFSALWGVVQLNDRIPSYRCSAGVSLPGIGPLRTYWKKALAGPLDELTRGDLVIDLRSGPYVPMWKPGNAVSVRVLHERSPGQRTIVSHFNKATKGRLVRDLLNAGAKPKTQAQLSSDLSDLKYTIEEGPGRLDVIVTEL